jgi:predicted deacylase
LTLELGESFVVNENNVRDGVKAIWDVLAHLKMVKPAEDRFAFAVPQPFSGAILRYSHQPVSSTSGIVRFLIRPGDRVRKGSPIARIYNVFGKLRETLRANEDGIVLGYSDSSVTFPGVPVAAFGVARRAQAGDGR